jgi:hypothetical protein
MVTPNGQDGALLQVLMGNGSLEERVILQSIFGIPYDPKVHHNFYQIGLDF